MLRPAIVVVLCLIILSSGTAATLLGQFGLIKALDELDIKDSVGATWGLIELRRDVDEHWFTLLGAGTTTPKAWDFGPLASVGVGQHLGKYDLLLQVTRGFIGDHITRNTTVRIALEFQLPPKSKGRGKSGDTFREL